MTEQTDKKQFVWSCFNSVRWNYLISIIDKISDDWLEALIFMATENNYNIGTQYLAQLLTVVSSREIVGKWQSVVDI